MFFQQRNPQCFQNNPQASFNRTSSNMQASSRLLSAMEPRTAGSAPAAGLKITDDQIDAIISKHLPLTPHLLSVPTTAPYPHEFPYENKNTSAARLFDPWEVKQLQYMTLVSHGDRGVGLAQGNWEDEINALSPHSMGLRSSTTTPNPHKERKNKISLTDYKKVLKGEMVMPKKSASPPAVKKPEEPRRADKPAPVNSIRGTDSGKPRAAVVENKRNGLGPAAQGNKPELKPPGRDHKGHSESQPTRSEPKGADKAPPRANGHLDRPAGLPPKPKDITAVRPSPKSDSIQKSKEPAKQTTSSRPQPSSTNLWDMKKKRPLDSPARDAIYPEKRTKTENGHARTPSGSLNPTPGRVGTPSDSKASPFKHGHSRSASNLSRVSPSQSLPQSKKATSKASDSRPQSSKPSPQKPVNSVPPLLSPLHPDLGGSDSVAFFASAHLQSDDRTPPKTPKKLAGNSTQKPSTNDSPLSSPLSTPPKSQQSFNNLPPPLSPMLPDILEQELAKLQQKSAQASILTVEARHEKARLPDTPGVARKTVKAKVGHPPKKERTSDVSQKSRDLTEKEPSYIVKLQYKKRRAKDIERILTLPAKPSKEFKRYEAQRLEAERERREPTTKTAFDQDSSDDDTPIATVAKKTVAKKRPSTEHVEPPPKRMKVPENVDASKAPVQVTPAFKSPGPNGPPQKSLLATPKKGDAMKGVLGGATMRKVDSSDGHAHTPQTISTSTPASAEKPRVANGDQRVRYDEIGLKLKRKMDVILRTKEPGGMDKISDQERKLGACVGLECVSAYMLNAYQATRNEKQLGRARQSVQWEQVFALWLFLDKVCRDTKSVLHALAVQIGAVCIDHLHSIHLERKDPKAFDSGKRREELWLSAHRMRGSLSELGPTRGVVLGPWSSVQEATNYAYGVLGAFAKKEKLEWKKED